MARTTKEVAMNGKSVEEIIHIIDAILKEEKYSEKIIDGEKVWSKGDGVIAKIQCFSVSFKESSFTLQAWMKDAITGESNLEGFVAIIPKKKMKALIEKIEKAI